jgi:hypothetical protein
VRKLIPWVYWANIALFLAKQNSTYHLNAKGLIQSKHNQVRPEDQPIHDW